MTVIFGYRHVDGIPLCPCRDPGNYVALEQPGNNPLEFVLRCWCGSTMKGSFDDMSEREQFLKANGVTT